MPSTQRHLENLSSLNVNQIGEVKAKNQEETKTTASLSSLLEWHQAAPFCIVSALQWLSSQMERRRVGDAARGRVLPPFVRR